MGKVPRAALGACAATGGRSAAVYSRRLMRRALSLRNTPLAVALALLCALAAFACTPQPNFTIPVCESLHTQCACQITGWIACDRVCVDPQNDARNCGGCGVRCDELCVEGRCVADCGDRERCGDRCRSDSDPYNCGACGNLCEGACAGGVCGATAADCNQGGLTACFGQCVNLFTDNRNCGECGRACSTGLCGHKRCCARGEVLCNGLCANLQTDLFNCGSCGHTCNRCENGECL